MKRHTQTILYHTLPIAFWLLAGVGCALWVFFDSAFQSEGWIRLLAAIPSLLSLITIIILTSIKRHASSVEESLWAGILLGIASYWLPTILFLLLPVWIYLYYRRLLDLHAFLASLIGIGLVAIWAAALIFNPFAQEPAIANPWVDFFVPETLWAWIPVGSVLFAYIASSIARNILKVR